jgi:biotin carboxylase
MARLLIGNDFNEDLRDDRKFAGWWVQRLAWFAEDGDVLVLPEEPEEFFLDYICGLTGVRRSTLRVVVPPPGQSSRGMLTADRLADPAFLAELGAVTAGRRIESVFPLWPAVAVASLSRALGLENVTPGFGFLAQGGGRLINSKPVFRAIAGGIGAPVPPGSVFTNADEAEDAIAEVLELGHPVILKQEFLSGGRGNEILSTVAGVRPYGARQVSLVTGREDVRSYLAENWARLTTGGRSPLVAERYYRDSPAIFAEFLFTGDGIELTGIGEMLPSSFAVGEIIPVPWLKPDTSRDLVEISRQICEPVYAMGYRGYFSVDAIVTPDEELLFTEFNGRVTGSTHVYGAVGQRVVGKDYADDRILLERSGWSVPSFQAAAAALSAAGFGYDPARRTGVVLLNAFDPQYNAVMYCVIAESLDAALARERELTSLAVGASA